MSGLFRKSTTISTSENRIGALRVQSSSQGLPIPIIYGANRLQPNNIDYFNFQAIAHVETSESGGKGGGGVSQESTTYTYSVGLLLALCEGPVVPNPVRQVWAGKEHQDPTLFTTFTGTSNQAAFDYLVSSNSAHALTYRGLCYAAASDYQLGSSPSVPNLSFEIYGLLSPSFCTPDVNPADVLIDYLTNEKHGAGWPADRLDDLSDLRTYCGASNFMVSPVYNEQQPAADAIKQLCQIANAAPVWSEGLLKVKPYGDSPVSYTPYTPNECSCVLGSEIDYIPDLTVQYALTDDDYITSPGEDPITVRRKRQSDTFNAVQIESLDRANEYNPHVVEAKDQWNIEAYGLRPAPMFNMHEICTKNVARNVAQTLLQRLLYVRNTYVFRLGWKYARLEPMDIVSLTTESGGLNLDAYLVRVTIVEEDEEGELTITAEDLSIGMGTPGFYGTQGTDGASINTNINPGDANTPVIFQPPVELSGVPQIWMGSAGGPNWGGAQVWASDDDMNYAQLGVLKSPARFGVLTANFPAASSPDTVNVLELDMSASQATLSSATVDQANGGDTLSYVGTATSGEIIAYTEANLVAPYQYDLDTYILRGLRCSVPGDHVVGESFMRLDGAVGKFAITEARVGRTIYIKLLSYNQTGGGLQTLEHVDPTTYVVQPLGIVAANGTIPDVIAAGRVLCVPENSQFSVVGRLTVLGRVNLDGRVIIT